MSETLWLELLAFLEAWGGWITLVSSLLFLAGLVLSPFVVVRIPVDYFSYPDRHCLRRGQRHPLIGGLIMALKNGLGGLLLLAGMIMLLGPGPGLITMFFGFYLMNFPGKYRLERWFIHQPAVLRRVNAMRIRRGQPPLEDPATVSP